jgi:hypothetical protein
MGRQLQTSRFSCRGEQGGPADGYRLDVLAPSTSTDEKGHFRLQGFIGMTYWLEAVGTREAGSVKALMHSEMIKLALGQDVTDLRVLLSQTSSGLTCPGLLKEKR